jgi:hypothetical protein
MSEERYADAIGEISLVGPTVRIDLVSLSPSEKDEKGQPKPVFRQRIVMPVDGFLQSFGLMSRVMQQLEQQGVIKRQPAGAAGAAGGTGAASTVPAAPPPPKSTNFK